jgi:hypothetical protein
MGKGSTRFADLDLFQCWRSGSGMGKKSGSGSGMNHPDHIYETLETIFWVQILKFFDADPGSGVEIIRSGIRDGKNSYPVSGETSQSRKLILFIVIRIQHFPLKCRYFPRVEFRGSKYRMRGKMC